MIYGRKRNGKRTYWKLRAGWSDLIAEAIWVQHQIDCVFSFKNHSVFRSAIAHQFLTFFGHCVECKATINGSLLKEPAKAVDIVLTCRIEGINSRMHSEKKRRHLKGERRRKMADAMINGKKDTVILRREEAGRLKKFGGKNPPILPSTAVLRKAKEQRLLTKYDLKFSNSALNLYNSSQNGKYAGCIHFIGLLKFNCIYWTPEQAQIYSARCRNNRNATLALDATGGIVKREKSHQPHVFLYQCVLITNQGSVSTFQMVSADHRALNIANLLRFILAANLPVPPIVVTDFGWALLIAVAEIFGRCSSLGDYLKKCYDAVLRKSVTLPSTYIRLDVSHVIAMVSRWNCLQRKEKILVRRLYLRCVAQMYKISNIDELSYFVKSVLSVALSQFIGHTPSNDILPSEERIRYLNDKIKGVPINMEEVDDDDADEFFEKRNIENEEYSDRNEGFNSDWKTWSDDQYDAAREIANNSSIGDTINACYNEDFAKRLKRYLLSYVALWTGVMLPIFGKGSTIATSAAVESEFCDIKKRVFKGELPMRVDKFIFKHLDHIDNKLKLLSNESDIQSADGRKQLPEITESQSSQSTLPTVSFKSEISFAIESENACSTPIKTSQKDTLSSRVVDLPQLSETILSTTASDKMIPSKSDIENSLDYDKKSIMKETTFIVQESPSGSLIDEISFEKTHHSMDKNIPADNDWIVCETWGSFNKNVKNIENDELPKPNRLKSTYLDNCPEWDFIKDSKIGRIPILRNGNISIPVNMGPYKLNMRNTCAFDSIFHVVVSGILNNRLYREKIISTNCPIIQLCYNVIDAKKLTTKHYKLRAEILKEIMMFEIKSYTRKIKSLDAKCNAAHLAQIILRSEPSYSYKVECSCGYTNSNTYALLDVNIDIVCGGFHQMQAAIDDNLRVNRSCFRCKKLVENHTDYGSHLIIDTSIVTDDHYENKNTIIAHTLGSIAKTVTIGQKSYILIGVVDYIAEKEHYIAYAPAGIYWYCYDDLLLIRKSVNPTTKITPHIIMYAICSDTN